MKTDKNDMMIRAFMQENKQEVPDVFFTRKVMQKLPSAHRSKEWIIIPFAALGSILAWMLGSIPSFQLTALQLPESFSIYYLLGGIATMPFIVLALYLIKEKRIQLL